MSEINRILPGNPVIPSVSQDQEIDERKKNKQQEEKKEQDTDDESENNDGDGIDYYA